MFVVVVGSPGKRSDVIYGTFADQETAQTWAATNIATLQGSVQFHVIEVKPTDALPASL